MGDMVHHPLLTFGSTYLFPLRWLGFTRSVVSFMYFARIYFYLRFNFSCTVLHSLYIGLW